MDPVPDDTIDWEGVAHNLQIENELLRVYNRQYQQAKIRYYKVDTPQVNWSKVLDWVDHNPMLCIVIIYAISTVVMDFVDILQKRR